MAIKKVSKSWIKINKRCRVCGSRELKPVLSLGKLYISNFIDADKIKKKKVPLELVLCGGKGGCGLLQLKHTICSEILYRNYWYKSGTNKTMTDELSGIAAVATKMVRMKKGDYALDVGSNDSTLLKSYSSKDIKLVGFEPAKNLVPSAKGKNITIINDFFNYKKWRINFGGKKAKIITAIAMFYDLDDPNKFVQDIADCLDKEGLFIIQMSYLPSMLKQNAFDNICHEHLEYYSLTSLENLLERHNLEVFDVELNDVNGGSFRTYIRHKGFRPVKARVKRLEDYERKLNLGGQKIYGNFAKRIILLKSKLSNFIKKESQEGKKIYVYGASTKGNTILQFCGLDRKLLKAAADRNPMKWGRKTVGTMIPIVPEEQARKEQPDYFLILPWHFLKEFLVREKSYLKNGGKFIVPLPELKIIKN